jgi:hypothetical protein
MNKYSLILGVVVFLFSKTNAPIKPNREFQIQVHDTNQVEMTVSNYGVFGQYGPEVPGCWWPKGTYHNYIYGAGIWFGTIDSLTGDTLVTVGYLPAYGESEVAPGLSGMAVNHPDAIIYMYPYNWPPPQTTFPMAPQTSLSHQDSWCCYNDSDITYHQSGDTPIGIEIYQTVYVWDISEIEDMIYLIYEVKNASGHTLQDCFIAVVTDCDIGNETWPGANDICTGIVDRTYFLDDDTIIVDDLGFQWQEKVEAGWAEFPGTIGFDLHQTPFDLVEGQDKDGDGILDQYERDSAYYVNNLPLEMWDVDNDGVPDWRDASENPQIGMTAFKRFTLDVEPLTDPERYMPLAGYNFLTGLYEPYDTIIPVPEDQRFSISSGPFELEPDSNVTVVFAVLFAEWYNICQTPDSALALINATAQLYYDMYWFIYTDIEEHDDVDFSKTLFTIYPNPARRRLHICAANNLMSEKVFIKIYDATGRLVKTLQEKKACDRLVWDLRDSSNRQVPSGVYFVRVEAHDRGETRKAIILR